MSASPFVSGHRCHWLVQPKAMHLALVFSLVLASLASIPVAGALSFADTSFESFIRVRGFNHLLLVARQTGTTLPLECQPTCNPVLVILDNCTPTECCSISFVQRVYDCFVCLGGATGQTDYSAQQRALDGLYLTCTAAGFKLPLFTLPGQDKNRPLPTGSGSATGTSVTPTSSPSLSSSSVSISQMTITDVSISPSASQITITSMPAVTTTQDTPTPPPTSTSAGNKESGNKLLVWTWTVGSLIVRFLIV